MKKDKHSQKLHHQDQSRRQKLQLQFRQVRRRRNVTAGLGVLLLIGLLVIEYYRSVPAWLYVVLWVIPFLLVLDTAYLKHLRQQLSKHA
jgi:hypothetical protein